jgi:hypothetical protein
MRIKDLIEADVTDLNQAREKRAREKENQKYSSSAGDRVKQREADFQQDRNQMKAEISKVTEEPFRLMGFPQTTLLDIMQDLRSQNVPTDYSHTKSWYDGYGEDSKRKLIGMFANDRNINQIIQRIDKAYNIYLEFSKKWNSIPYSDILRDDVAYLKINRGKVNVLSIFFNKKSVEEIKESRLDRQKIIAESLDNPYPYRRSRPKSSTVLARYVFQTESLRKGYSINLYDVHTNAAMLEFDRQIGSRSTVEKTLDSQKEVLRIFATVRAVLKDFIVDSPKINVIYIEGKTEEGETIDDSNRISLYRNLANRVKRELGWESVSERSTSNAVMWAIRKSNAPVFDKPSPTQDIPSSKKKKK